MSITSADPNADKGSPPPMMLRVKGSDPTEGVPGPVRWCTAISISISILRGRLRAQRAALKAGVSKSNCMQILALHSCGGSCDWIEQQPTMAGAVAGVDIIINIEYLIYILCVCMYGRNFKINH